jgi:hypothetical protein
VVEAESAAFEQLMALATKVLSEHTNNHGRCAACGGVFPCERAVLAEHNLAAVSPP